MAQASSPTKFSTIWNMSFGFLGIQFGWGSTLDGCAP
jgi:hypothetical protein